MRLLLCSGDKQLDAYVRGKMPDAVVGETYYREAVRESYLRFNADTLLLATGLVGVSNLREMVFSARMDGLRVVYLVGESERATSLPYDLLAMGVYDFLFSPINAEDIIMRLREPAGFPQAAASLKVQAPQGGSLLQSLFRRAEEAREQPPGEESGGPGLSVSMPHNGKVRKPSETTVPSEHIVRGRERREEPRRKDDGLKAFKAPYPILAVWSPVSAGKTLVATNLAWVLSLTGPTTLIDLDEKQAVREWLLIPEKEDSLLRGLRESSKPLPDPARVGDLNVYCCDPNAGKPQISPSKLARILSSPQLAPGPVVLDMPADALEMERWGYDLLKALKCCVIVGDPDWSHRTAVRQAIDWATKEGVWPILILNRYAEAEVPGWDQETILGLKPAAILDARDCLVYKSIASGKPMVVLDHEWKKRFDELAVWALTAFSRAHPQAAPFGAA